MTHPTATIQPPLDLEAMWQKSLIRVSDQLTIPPVVLRVDEAIIGTLGNFSVSTGKAKAKKTFNVCALVAAALINGQVLEYRASFPESKRDILYFDTEQSPYHCQLVMQRILSLAGLPLDQEPEHLKFSHLRAIADPNQRRALIRYAIYNSPNLGLVIIDGIRDLMHNINNSAEATNLVGDLMQWTGEKNIHIQTVLHLNKGDDNARGHIGTELNNKAESVLLIAKDTKDADRSVVSPAVIRSKAFAPFAFKLSEDDGICLPELDTEFAVTNSHSFSYQELSGEEHRKALQETFKSRSECVPIENVRLTKELNPNQSLDRYSATRNRIDNFLSSFIFLLASCLSFVLAVARYAFELTTNNLLNNQIKSVLDLMTDLGLTSKEK